MKIRDHLEKVEKFEALRSRLDSREDFELWFWSAMNAGTNAVNAALHHAKITNDHDSFPMQPGVYLVPQRDGTLRPELRALGDILHVGRPAISGPIPEDILEMMHAMEVIENQRDPCVRGEREPSPAIVDECDKAVRRCLRLLHERISG